MTYSITSSTLMPVIAGELNELARAIEAMGEALCGDDYMLANHLVQLQAIDLIAQTLRCQAKLMVARDLGEALEDMGLEDLRARLSSAIDMQIAKSQMG